MPMEQVDHANQERATAKLVVEDVSKWYKTSRATVHALDNINLAVAEGEFICLVGPSGCGKSTLLDIIAGLTKPDHGRVLADNQPVEGPGRHRLVMFQESALFPWLTVMGNVMFGLKLKPGLANAKRREIAREHLELVGLQFMPMRMNSVVWNSASPSHFGANPRASHGRAASPRCPTRGSSTPTSNASGKSARPSSYVTHNVREAARLDWVILISPRPGRIV
jgi:NitT/TauT family transport system ATP-binding protein